MTGCDLRHDLDKQAFAGAWWGGTGEPEGGTRGGTGGWHCLPGGFAMFHERYGDTAEIEIDERIRLAHDGIPRTLEAIKRIAETS